ncbi:MAG: hypothetical protein R6T96_10205 [Longimicrobiales bacterium]
MFGRKDNDSAWKSRFPELATCVRCLEQKDVEEMDRLLWCQDCRESARQRAAVWGWGFGTLLAALLAIWIWVVIQPSDLIIPGWIATVVAALWISSRVAREVAYGVYRFSNRKAAEAVPPRIDEPGPRA